ncbi:hypothetical protein CEXT_502351 [Caerostris extrusa]|uniref:Uncharacterized protein n=1 Tax=Caerostris extrusa TaxID=172846 RepID=A0AAV4T0T7_CAEEX|nr:hypothetical protein CEXT_502351 [Caerostris extrusa]
MIMTLNRGSLGTGGSFIKLHEALEELRAAGLPPDVFMSASVAQTACHPAVTSARGTPRPLLFSAAFEREALLFCAVFLKFDFACSGKRKKTSLHNASLQNINVDRLKLRIVKYRAIMKKLSR